MSQSNNPGRFSDQDIEAVRRGFTSDHGRYIALMDLSHFLSNENVDSLLPAAEVVLNRPLAGQINPSMVELPTASRNLDLDTLTPPAPPLPRMMKNLLKDRHRFQRQFVSSAAPLMPSFDGDIVSVAHKALENYQLTQVFQEEEMKATPSSDKRGFAMDLLFSSIVSSDVCSDKFIKSEMQKL